MTLERRETGATRSGRWLAALLCGLLTVGAPVLEASALDKGQITQMTKLGLDDKAIKGAIDSAGDELMLTEAELTELKDEGVSDEVLEYLRQTGHVKEPAGGADTDAPRRLMAGTRVTGPHQGRARGRALGPGPAPGEEPEEDQGLSGAEVKKLLELVKQIEAQKGKVESSLQGKRRQVDAAIKSLEQGGENMEAARTCLGYLAGYRDYLKSLKRYQAELAELNVDPEEADISVDTAASPEVEGGVYFANFCLGRALFNEGIYSGASRPTVQVLQAGAGPDRPHFKESFYMLEKISAKIGYKPPILEEITATSLDAFNPDFRDDFNYYFGKFFFDYGRMQEARKRLSEVREEAEDYPEARYLEGVAVLGGVQSDQDLRKVARDALTAFQDAIVAAEAERGGNEEILQLGYLALARTFYELGFYNVALYYYQKLPAQSSRNAEAKLEQAWTYFLKNDYKKALGIFHMLHSPYYEKWFFPDLELLEATVYLNLCKFEKSKLALAELDKQYLSKQQPLKDFITKMQGQEPSKSWNTLVTYYEQGEGAANKTGLPQMFADAVLDDLSFFNAYKQIQALRVERDALKANIGALGEFGEEVLAQVEERLQLKVDEGGLLVLQKLGEIDQELDTLSIKATQIDFDIDKEEKEELAERLANPDYERATVSAGTTLLIVADDWHPWPFEGEYWLDEVSSYRSNLRTECVEQP